MAYDDVFPSLARPPKNVQRQMDGSLPLSKISNYIMNVFCLVFSKPTEINVMFGLFPKLLHVFSMCFSLKQRGFIEHGALFPKIQSPVAICLCWLAWSGSWYGSMSFFYSGIFQISPPSSHAPPSRRALQNPPFRCQSLFWLLAL
jgi:hypothetical protein